MNKAKVVREAARLAMAYVDQDKPWSFYSCNVLQQAYFAQWRKMFGYDREPDSQWLAGLQAEYAALFDDATFWVGTRPGKSFKPSGLPMAERNFDRACCLLMFAEIVR